MVSPLVKFSHARRPVDQTFETPIGIGTVAKLPLSQYAFQCMMSFGLQATVTEVGVPYDCQETQFGDTDITMAFSLPAGRKLFITLTKENVLIVKGNPACKDVGVRSLRLDDEGLTLTLRAPQIVRAYPEPDRNLTCRFYAQQSITFDTLLSADLNPHIEPLYLYDSDDNGFCDYKTGGSWVWHTPTTVMIPMVLSEGGCAYLFIDFEKRTYTVSFDARAYKFYRQPSITLLFEQYIDPNTQVRHQDEIYDELPADTQKQN